MPRLGDLHFDVPVVAAPMAGGPTTPELVGAAAAAGGVGFVAAGYRSAAELSAHIAAVRRTTPHFAVNLFAPPAIPVDPQAFRDYRHVLQAAADRYGIELAIQPREDDDDWDAKIDLLRSDPVPAVSFTFGIPENPTLRALRRAGIFTLQTVTSPTEIRLAAEAGVDALVVQSFRAGGHLGTFTPRQLPPSVSLVELVEQAATTKLPIVAGGGVGTRAEVAAILRAGADAAAVGTLLLRSDEAGTSATHRRALAGGDRETVVTRAFSGRPARGLRNDFFDRYDDLAPLGYPAVHYLTSPLRQAAAAAGDRELVNLWAGTGYRFGTDEPVAAIFARLAAGLS